MTARPAALVAAAALALLAGCGTAATPPATAPASPAATQVVRVTYAGGQVGGDTGTVPVALGTALRLEVTSDVAEEAHLHGYDEEVQVPAGGTATIDLTADIPGEFEFELHHSGAALATLRVS
jgi:hypothetical protein